MKGSNKPIGAARQGRFAGFTAHSNQKHPVTKEKGGEELIPIRPSVHKKEGGWCEQS